MKLLQNSRPFVVVALLVSALAVSPFAGFAQGVGPGVKEAYFRAVGEHFSVSEEEVAIIGEWRLTPDEVPVVLFIASQAGVSPDALIGLRRRGLAWREVAGQLGLQPQAFHVPIPAGTELGTLARVCGEFRRLPVRDWSQIVMEDHEVVGMVNLRVLSEQTGATPQTILLHFGNAGSFVASYLLLLGG